MHEAHVIRLVPDVPAIGPARRSAVRKREKWSSHDVTRSRPRGEQSLVLLGGAARPWAKTSAGTSCDPTAVAHPDF